MKDTSTGFQIFDIMFTYINNYWVKKERNNFADILRNFPFLLYSFRRIAQRQLLYGNGRDVCLSVCLYVHVS